MENKEEKEKISDSSPPISDSSSPTSDSSPPDLSSDSLRHILGQLHFFQELSLIRTIGRFFLYVLMFILLIVNILVLLKYNDILSFQLPGFSEKWLPFGWGILGAVMFAWRNGGQFTIAVLTGTIIGVVVLVLMVGETNVDGIENFKNDFNIISVVSFIAGLSSERFIYVVCPKITDMFLSRFVGDRKSVSNQDS